MSYRIRPDRALDDEVHKAAAHQLGKAMAVLTDRPQGLHEAVHDARKNIKRVRALYRLIAPVAREFQQRENDRLRNMARTLSGVRDATALIEIGHYLQATARSAEELHALTRVSDLLTTRRDRLAAAQTDLEDKAQAAVAICAEAREALKEISFDCGRRDTARLFQKSWRKNVRKAMQALSECHAEAAHVESFHDLRKRSQDYWMHHMLLRDVWPAAMHAKQLEAKALVDVLGRYLDMSILADVADREPHLFDRSDDHARLLEAIIARQQTARGEALERGRWVFADKPESEARTIKHLWLEAAN
ncbi:CHAD domain-containing protein [Rhizobium dioscoreae]|uniref:CHAD domain-containing protein n=1 Tax=Rhizobium dioscoreae TaxID=2653122 RepID=A0ABQ0YW78_9HYPH|nr:MULTISPECIES: CHAD domain-containing protein [Rhizobium]MCZ3377747.1 CHAD domain-containing protein [Rhizobium sp. AG207R]TWB17463.1 CHAD domain-containing protein [Rhizobium sp. ERR1071]GES44124.1 CHAD domain-containing protein [Rhizobium dioscoreae]GES47520.1 CHAD domain-containing protein [Rhizobium dioscoreae]GLU80015.1 CHAD domain-containing protein [Rhizobium sp. NBRC 114257]